MSTLSNYEVVLRPNQNWLHVNWAELWRGRDLLLLLVKRDFISKYKQTILGPTWFVIQPLLLSAVQMVIFGFMAGLSTPGIPTLLFYLCSNLCWLYIQGTVQATGSTFVQNLDLFGKVYFPRVIMPAAVSLSSLIPLAIQYVVFILAFLFYFFFTSAGELMNPQLTLLLLPFVILQTIILSLGIGLLLSALTAKYRDVTQLLPFFLQIWMLGSAIVYPVSEFAASERLPALADYTWVLWLNPVTAIVEFYRFSFFGSGTVTLTTMGSSLLTTCALFVLGFFAFRRTERTFMDTV